MAISNFTFTRIYNDLKGRLTGAKISKIVKISALDFSFFLFAKKQESLIFSLDGANPYMLISGSYFKMIAESGGFTSSLRKYFENGTVLEFTKEPYDKIFTFVIKKMTPSYQLITSKLIVELIPFRPNAIITDENGVIIDALKKSSSLDDAHLIAKGVHYTYPAREEKDFDESDTLDTLKEKMTRLVYQEVTYRVEHGESLKDILHEIKTADKYYAYKNDITSLYLKSKEGCREIKLEDISSVYEEKEETKYKKDHYDLAISTVSHKLKGLRKKVINLESDLKKAYSKEDYVTLGNLLFMGQENYHKGMKEIEIEGITIPLDEKLDLSGNANRYFKEYQKSKKAIEQVKIQIDLAKEKIDYFEKIENQIGFATPSDMEEILSELKSDGYLPKEKNQNNKKNVKKVPSVHSLTSSTGMKIYFGLSSIQNDYLTFEFARKDDYFLHIKDVHGPHVIIPSSDPDKETILLAGETAVYFAGKTGGEVYLADKKDVKKVPGKLGLVTINKCQTINISSIRESSVRLFKESLKK